jgi:hypothetical protein
MGRSVGRLLALSRSEENEPGGTGAEPGAGKCMDKCLGAVYRKELTGMVTKKANPLAGPDRGELFVVL